LVINSLSDARASVIRRVTTASLVRRSPTSKLVLLPRGSPILHVTPSRAFASQPQAKRSFGPRIGTLFTGLMIFGLGITSYDTNFIPV